MEKIKIVKYEHDRKVPFSQFKDPNHAQYHFFCEGCNRVHTLSPQIHQFNNSLELPTFTPSILFDERNNIEGIRCHSFIVNGKIKYLNDCNHRLKGQEIELKPLEEWKHLINY